MRKRPSHWSAFLNRNPFVYIDNDALKLVHVQNVTTTHGHEPFPVTNSVLGLTLTDMSCQFIMIKET